MQSGRCHCLLQIRNWISKHSNRKPCVSLVSPLAFLGLQKPYMLQAFLEYLLLELPRLDQLWLELKHVGWRLLRPILLGLNQHQRQWRPSSFVQQQSWYIHISYFHASSLSKHSFDYHLFSLFCKGHANYVRLIYSLSLQWHLALWSCWYKMCTSPLFYHACI